MPTDKIIDGNRITDADPIPVQLDAVSRAALENITIDSITIPDGGDATQGAKADAAWQGAATGTEIALLKAIAGIVAPRKRARGLLTTAAAVVPIPSGTKVVQLYCSTLTKAGVGAGASYTAPTQERQTITAGDATSGNWTAGFQGQTSGNLAWNISGANLVTGLVALSSIGAGGVTLISGGPLNTTPIVIEFAADILDGDQPMLTPVTVDLAGGVSAGSRLPVVTESTAAATSVGFCEAGAVLTFAIASTDAYLYLKADAGTGNYRVSWYS